MGLFTGNSKTGIMDVIRCDESDYLIWKWHPQGSAVGETNRENAIRWGSSLRVKEGSVAVFVYSSSNGTVQDYIEGPADTIVNNKNLPIISSIIGLAYNGESPFQAEVYYINLANTVQIKFAVPYFDVFEPEYDRFGVPVAVRGSVDFNILDYKAFIKAHRLDNFAMSDLQSQIRDSVVEKVKSIVANVPYSFHIPVIQMERKISEIKLEIVNVLKEKLFEDYGITVKDINIAAIEIDKNSAGYKNLETLTVKQTLKDTIASHRSGRIKGYANIGIDVAKSAIDVKEDQFSCHKKLQREYHDEVEDERAGKIGAVGGKLVRDISKLVHGKDKASSQTTPPPIPISYYNVAVDGQPTGPYDVKTLAEMSRKNQFSADSLVWKSGMEEWTKAGEIEELKAILNQMPPIPD